MKNWIVALAIIAMLGMTGFADAGGGKGKGKKSGIHGKIQSVSGNTVTLSSGGKKNPHTVTVTLAANATVTIDGVAGKLDSSLVGKTASVDGAENNGAVTSSSITVVTKHHHKKKAA